MVGDVVVKVPKGFEYLVERREGASLGESVHERLLRKIRDRAEALARLDHPGIVRLLAYRRDAPVLVYEYAPYGTLAWQLAHGWKPGVRDSVLVGIQVGDALRYIHSRGLVHGDIKPGNVFIGGEGRAKLGDFSGLVRLLSSASRTGLPSQYTIGFRAPEQVYVEYRNRARMAGVENRVDVYQLGNLILFLLTGETVDGEEVMEASEKLEEVSIPELRELLSKMLAPDPVERPGMEAVLEELARIYDNLD